MKLLLTSAWNPASAHTPDELRSRRERIRKSIVHYLASAAIDQVILLDATLSEADAQALTRLSTSKLTVLTPSVHPVGDFSGPSYLEALLYLGASEQLQSLIAPHELCMKVSGGYIVNNLDSVLRAVVQKNLDAVGYLHQNPLRIQPRFAMTSCMVMRGRHWMAFFHHVRTHLEQTRTTPLEAVYRAYLESIGAARGTSLPYPRLDAYFSTGRMHSSSFRYRARESFWRLYSRTGLFVLSASS